MEGRHLESSQSKSYHKVWYPKRKAGRFNPALRWFGDNTNKCFFTTCWNSETDETDETDETNGTHGNYENNATTAHLHLKTCLRVQGIEA